MAEVLLDCDGVLADLTGYVLDWLGNPIRVQDIHTWDFFTALAPEDVKRAHKLMSSGWFWGTLPVMPGAVAAVNALRDAGHTVTVVTSSWRGCVEWGEQRYCWLTKHFHIDSADVAVMHKKWLVPGDVFVDDKPDHVVAWQKAHPRGRAYLAVRPGNKDFDWPYRVDWSRPDQVKAMTEYLDSRCHDK